MKRVLKLLAGTGIFTAFLVLFALASGASGVGSNTLFDADWRFALGDYPDAQQPQFDDSRWISVELPHDWSIGGPIAQTNTTGGGGGFFPAGVGWYRKTFTLPAETAGQRVTVRFDGVYMLSEVWVNGQRVGMHPYGYTPFSYDVTAQVKSGQANTIAVRVDNSKQMNSRWYSGSGIYRHVWLELLEPIHLQPAGVWVRTVSAEENEAVLKIGMSAENAGGSEPATVSFATKIFALDVMGKHSGTAVASLGPIESRFENKEGKKQTAVEADVTVTEPRLWSPEHPDRYVAVTTLTHAGRVVDTVETPLGIRTIEVSAEKGFLLNGEPVLLYGGCVHHDNGALGAAAFDRAEERRVELLKVAGFNAVRTSHNPPSSAFLEACDRLGLMVMDEAFDCWEKGKNNQDYHLYFKDWWQRDIDAMVLRDRNHPSVVMWSIGNEIPDFGSAQGLRDGTKLIERIKELDPTRPVTAGVTWYRGIGGRNNDWQWNDTDALMGKLDVTGYNYQIQRYTRDHQRVPERVIVSTESFPRDIFASWQTSVDQPWIIGDFVWTAMDYLGEAGIGRVWLPGERTSFHGQRRQFPYHGAYCGDIDITGFRKPVSYARNITWDRGEKLYTSVTELGGDGKPLRVEGWGIVPSRASWTWPGQEGKSLEVQVYSRYERVRLSLNGAVVGEKPTGRAQQFKAMFSVPYTPGVLKTEGLVGDKVVATSELKTAGPVAKLRLTVDRDSIRADGQDLSFITVESVDADGNFQPNGDQEVTFDVTGAGTLAGVASADFGGTEGYQGKTRRLFQGRAQAIVRAAHQMGTVEVRATADGLTEASTKIEVR
jgi:beta-galactosidase